MPGPGFQKSEKEQGKENSLWSSGGYKYFPEVYERPSCGEVEVTMCGAWMQGREFGPFLSHASQTGISL